MSEPKRFKRHYTSFEQLPNELLIEIFTYLYGVDTVYAFSQLNTRFQSLLIQYVNIFDFKSISKAKFDYVIQHHDIHQWRSLRLSDDNETPGQIRLFCQRYPLIQYISQLRSLCALNMTPEYAQEFLSQFKISPGHLASLHIENIFKENIQLFDDPISLDIRSIRGANIQSFDYLVSLEIGNICGENIQAFELPSLKRLVVTGCKHTGWMMNFHSLESLEYTVEYNCHHNHVLLVPKTLRQLKLFYMSERIENFIQNLLRQSSQLTKLALYEDGCDISMPNGETWEQFIQSSLPLLKNFQFCFPFRYYRRASNAVKQAVTSFTTPFYLQEKHWFIRCVTNYNQSTISGILYSLPFAFAQMPINITSFDTSMSTLVVSDINQTKYESYKKVETLFFNERCRTPYQRFDTSNIVRLVLSTTFFSDWISLLTNLRHLEIREAGSTSSNDFARLLASTSQLRSLTIATEELEKLTDRFTNTAVCDHLSQHIQSLTFAFFYAKKLILDVVNVRLLSAIVRIFGKKCEHLSLALAADPDTFLPILQRMEQLRSLRIKCHSWYSISQNIITSWLQSQSTSSVQLHFVNMIDETDCSVWFGNRSQ